MPAVFAVVVMSLISMLIAGAANAQVDQTTLTALTRAVNEMCLTPDRRGDYFRIEGNADASGRLRVVTGEIGGTITRESWNGINQRIDQYKTDPRQCAVQILPLLLNSFLPNRQSGIVTRERSEVVLQTVIGEFMQGIVDGKRYASQLKFEIERQKGFIFPLVQSSGRLESLSFVNSTTNDTGKRIDQFIAYHRSANFIWSISFANEETIDWLYVQPLAR